MNRNLNVLLLLAVLAMPGCGTGDADRPTEHEYDPVPDGAQRVTLALDDFELGSGLETYKCQTFQNPFGRDVAILQSQTSMSAGSHHLLVFRVDQNENGPLEDCSGLEFHQALHTAQTPHARVTYPPGVGASYVAADGIRLNAHYLNLSKQTIEPRIEVVLDVVDASAVTEMAGPIYLNDSMINVPPGEGTAGSTMVIPPEVGSIQLLRVQSHMHRHAVHFELSVDGGAPLYETDSWNEPPSKEFSPEVMLHPGSALTWRCRIQNDTNETITFGESAATNEMCTMTGYYYPAPQGMALVGDPALGKIMLAR
jgi:hypothetical protein